MKKQRILALAMGTVIGLGSIFGGSAYADTTSQKDNAGVCTQAVCESTIDDELLAKSVLTKAELKQYNGAIEEIMKLYDAIEGKELNDETLEKLFEDEEKIYEDNKVVFDKVDAYFDSLDDSPSNRLDDEDYGDIELEFDEDDFYAELKENNVLNDDEIAKYIEAEKQINDLYMNATDDSNFDEIDKKADQIIEQNKALFDKVDQYYTSLDQMDLDSCYDELLEYGDLTKEQVEQLKAADKKVDELYANLPENPSEEELNELDKKVEAIYQDMDFLNIPDCGDCGITLY